MYVMYFIIFFRSLTVPSFCGGCVSLHPYENKHKWYTIKQHIFENLQTAFIVQALQKHCSKLVGEILEGSIHSI